MALMSPLDAGFLMFEAREKPLHVGGLQIFEPPADAGPDHLRTVYEDALGFRDVRPLFSRRPARMLGIGPWSWVEDDKLDLEYHVRHSALPSPGRVRELLALVGRLHGTLLDRTRPLWEAHLIEGLEGNRFAVYTKIHHALVDGVSAMGILQDALSTDADERDMPPPWVPRERNRPRRAEPTNATHPSLLRAVGGGAMETLEVVRRMATVAVEGLDHQSAAVPFQAPRTMLNGPISGARRFAGQSWPLERLRRVASAVDGTINDVVLGMSAGALRRYLLSQGALPEEPLVAMVPVSMRGDEGAGEGNAVGMVLTVLATNVVDPLERFETVLGSIRRAKAHVAGLSTAQAMALNVLPITPFLLTSGLRLPTLTRPPFNVVISNVPGPKETLHWNGARLQANYPVSIPVDGVALNITCTSYADELSFGLVGCRRSVPSLQRLLGDLDESLVELEDAVC